MQNEIKKICIITDINGIYGFGHFTRMKFIANKLKNFYDFIFSSINDKSDIYSKPNIETCKFKFTYSSCWRPSCGGHGPGCACGCAGFRG